MAADEADDLGIPMKPARPAAPASAAVSSAGRPPAPGPVPMQPARNAEPPRPMANAEPPRPAELPRRAPEPPPPRRSEGELRKLIVGREISLSGEINSCDKLIVEGSVEANLQNCRDVDIAESGLFKGAASVDDAEVRGRFEGNLIVRNRLFVRASGRVCGTIRYGQIEIECGGQISGDIQAEPRDDVVTELAGARSAH